MTSSIRLGRIFGIPLNINYSWLIIFGLVILLMSSRFADLYPRWPVAAHWIVAAVTTALFFLSVLLHELSHSLVAVARGIQVKGITLFIFGGVSELAHEAHRPMSEFVVTIVGPATSLAIALVCGSLWFALDGGPTYVGAILFTLAAINLSLGIFNMLPGFPLDGGRVLRAALWGATGNYWLATRIAIRSGQALGGLMVAGGILWAFYGNFQGLWVSLVGGFLLFVASGNYRQEATRNFLKIIRVGDALPTQWPVVSGSLPAFSPEALMSLSRSNYLGLLVAGSDYGVVTGQDLTQVGAAADPGLTLDRLKRPLSEFPLLDADASALEALELMDARESFVAVILRNGLPLGLVSRTKLLSLVTERRQRRNRLGILG
ncbi:MAG: site-2 protease family protein [Chloroflexi bacterium]|nr:site-2 protease family protein [Chloroflexota bacterium]